MADSSSPYFSLSDSDADSDAENLISQSIDLHALQQITALNTCHLPDSVLPSDLVSRFLRLKSLPPAPPQPGNPRLFADVGDDEDQARSSRNPLVKDEFHTHSLLHYEPMKKPTPLVAKDEAEITSPNPEKLLRKKKDQSLNSIFWTGSLSSTSVSSPASRHRHSSPPQRTGCFWCSPKKKLKYEEDLALDFDLGYWGEDGVMLSDFSLLSVKDQQRRLKTAMKEAEKIKREAKKVVKSVKHASSSTDLSKFEYSLDKIK